VLRPLLPLRSPELLSSRRADDSFDEELRSSRRRAAAEEVRWRFQSCSRDGDKHFPPPPPSPVFGKLPVPSGGRSCDSPCVVLLDFLDGGAICF